MSWTAKPLGEILDQSGHHRAGDQDLPVLSITMKHGLVDQADKFKKRVASSDTSNYRIAYKNELVVGFPIDEGVLGFQTKYPAGIVSPAYNIWKLQDATECHIPYLERFLRSPQARSLYASRMQGAVARRRSLTKSDFLNLEIPFPPLDDQIRIAHLLGKVEGLIAERKQHLQKLDDLLKSVFTEMFGDIRAQKSNHPWRVLRPYLKASSGKSSKSVISKEETGIPIFGGNGVNGRAIKALYETPVVVAGRVGQQCGVIHVTKGPCWVTDNAIVLGISDDSKLNIAYLAKAFHYAPIRERVKQLDLPFINQSMLLDYPLPLPPINLQNQFATIVEKIEDIKARYRQGFNDLEVLYGALSQQAFKGELDLSRVPLPTDQDSQIHGEPVERQAGRSSLPEGAVAPTEVINNLVQAAQPQGGDELLARWFSRYLANTSPDARLGSAQLLQAAWQTLHESQLENDGETPVLTLDDYDSMKDWVFKKLASSELIQTFDGSSNRVALQRQSADWGTW